MHFLQSGVDITLIALWLGHESPPTTHIYVEDLEMKEGPLKLVQPLTAKQVRHDVRITAKNGIHLAGVY
jgi:integrase/recombinase XerD